MLKHSILLCLLCTILAGCSGPQSGLIGDKNAASDQDIEIPPLVTGNELPTVVDNRDLIETINTLSVSRTKNGILVYASGTAAFAGAYNAQLVLADGAQNGAVDDKTLTLNFKVAYPQTIPPKGNRKVDIAALIKKKNIKDISTIRVVGLRSSRQIRF